MFAAIKAFFSGSSAKLAEILALILSAIGLIAGIFNAGKGAEKTKEMAEEQKQENKAHEVENSNSALSDSAVDQRLRDKWGQ